MNIYDCAHALAKAIKTSPEYLKFQKAGEELRKDKSAKEMLEDLSKAQIELQKQRVAGLEVAPEQEKRLSQMLEIVNLNKAAREYMEAEYRFSIMLIDVQNIISKAMEDLGPSPMPPEDPLSMAE
ncbi:MAG: YlbF family regulator [Dethiobacteria bacterium]|jgi:cell fate (sporulation/competence/biofilm development) regulator YlbF (YheA/YmcA/DUF963 family)